MKHYKPMYAKDSERLIVFDENMKTMSFWEFMLRGVSFLALLFLSAIAFCWGVSLDAVQAKLESIDQWADHPANSALISYVGVVALIVVLFTYVLWVFLLRKK